MWGKLSHTVKELLAGKRGSRGESLVEVLMAIVIGGLALVVLAMAISTASRMAIDSRTTMNDYYRANNTAIANGSGLGSGEVTLKVKGDSDSSPIALVSDSELNVSYYANNELGSSAIILYESDGA